MSVTSLTGAEGYSISATGRKRDRLFIYNFILQIQFSLTSLLFKKRVLCRDGTQQCLGAVARYSGCKQREISVLSFP